ncbi:MAG: beta-hydroxyacyl-ACP dehydratase [Bacteroidales bacterium]|nr:beta-hydroxyacyl-ACP dehydratase [Bacteroidales bacterium]
MLLKDKYFKVQQENILTPFHGVYLIALLPDADVYRGHFPHKPVCPGVCNIETIRECAEMLSGKNLMIKTIKQCRLTAVATPEVCPLVDVNVMLTSNQDSSAYIIQASIADAETTYMELKGELAVNN